MNTSSATYSSLNALEKDAFKNEIPGVEIEMTKSENRTWIWDIVKNKIMIGFVEGTHISAASLINLNVSLG